MKKVFSLILALTLVLSMGTTAFAAENEDQTGVGTGSYDASVYGVYVPADPAETVYSVDIAWSGLNFTYNEEVKDWNPTTHKYDTKTEAGWAKSNAKIKVTNHSNTAITATPKWNAETDYKSVTMGFAYSKGTDALKVDSAETSNKAEEGTITVTPGGTLASGVKDTKIGTITVTIAQAASSEDNTPSE